MQIYKNEKDYTVVLSYSCNSGWCTVQSIEVLAKNNDKIDCEKVAKKLYKSYKDDVHLLYNDIVEFGDAAQKAEVSKSLNEINKRTI